MNAFRHEEVIHHPSVDSGEVLMSKSMSLQGIRKDVILSLQGN